MPRILNDLRSTPNYGMSSLFPSQEPRPVYLRKTMVNPVIVTNIEVGKSLDMQVSKAESFFYTGEYKKCMDVLDE